MQPIAIEDPNIQRKIHNTYRLQYLKDVILGRALDDSTFNVLNTCIIFNQIEIINHIQQDEHFLRELVLLFVRPPPETESTSGSPSKDSSSAQPSDSPSTSQPTHPASDSSATRIPTSIFPSSTDDRKKEVILLLQQLCTMGKNVQLPARLNLFRTLVERGVLYAVQWALTRPEKHLVFMAGEILTVLLDHGTVAVRNHVLVQAVALGQPTGTATTTATSMAEGPQTPLGVVGGAGPSASQGPGLGTGWGEGPGGAKNILEGMPAPFKETLAQVLCRMLAISQDFALQNLVADSLRLLADVPPPEPVVEQPGAGAGAAGGGPSKPVNRPLRDDPSTERFLDNFYKVCVEALMWPLTHDVPDHRELKGQIFLAPFFDHSGFLTSSSGL